jgi:Uma2 family endonuclease
MNQLSRPPGTRATTQAAEGVPRLRWTLAEFERLTELGIFTEEDRIELIGGELVPMSPKGNRHELVRDDLTDLLVQQLPRNVRLASEIGWRPDADTYLEPDMLVYPRTFKGVTVPGAEVLLIIEIADTSLNFDITAKARVYAALGVREYWVVDAKTLVTRIHREPSAQGFAILSEVLPSETLIPALVPSIAAKLVDLGLD